MNKKSLVFIIISLGLLMAFSNPLAAMGKKKNDKQQSQNATDTSGQNLKVTQEPLDSSGFNDKVQL